MQSLHPLPLLKLHIAHAPRFHQPGVLLLLELQEVLAPVLHRQEGGERAGITYCRIILGLVKQNYSLDMTRYVAGVEKLKMTKPEIKMNAVLRKSD